MAVYTQIDNPELYFQVALYTGNYSTQSITFDGSEDMQPDMVWIKERSVSGNHQLQDSVRGTSKKLMPNSSDAEGTESAYITSFDSDGFSIGQNNGINQSGVTNVAWCWKESATAGFDIVSYTGNGSARTISHSLSAKPGFFVVKGRSYGEEWECYHTSLGATKCLQLNADGGEDDLANRFNDTEPTTSVFTVGDADAVNKNTYTYITYLFAEKQGFSKFGSYTGNGNANGTYIHLGFRPAWFLTKKSSASGNNWTLWDNKRDAKNPMDLLLHPNSSNAENDSGDNIDFCSNGIKFRNTAGGGNASGATYIYMAFAEQPFVNSNGVPCNAR